MWRKTSITCYRNGKSMKMLGYILIGVGTFLVGYLNAPVEIIGLLMAVVGVYIIGSAK